MKMGWIFLAPNVGCNLKPNTLRKSRSNCGPFQLCFKCFSGATLFPQNVNMPTKAKAAAQSSAPAAEDKDELSQKRQKTEDAKALIDWRTYFMGVSTGHFKKSTQADKDEIAIAFKTMCTLEDDDKTLFAKKVKETKGSKHFGWIRKYSERIDFNKAVQNKFSENYYTRIQPRLGWR